MMLMWLVLRKRQVPEELIKQQQKASVPPQLVSPGREAVEHRHSKHSASHQIQTASVSQIYLDEIQVTQLSSNQIFYTDGHLPAGTTSDRFIQ